jgi:formylglycine-generating enzyme required for sulfatase activity
VNINYEFYLGKFEVTQAQWKAVMGSVHSGMKGLDSEFFGNDLPVVRISWDDAKTFVDRLNSMDDRYTYRLPSEAEWEYAARAGTQTRFYWGDDPDFTSLCKYANVKDYSGCPDGYKRTAPIKTYLPNAFGLYDMTGNVWEWCEDIWQLGYREVPTDGSPNLTVGDSSKRAQRGGSWADHPRDTRLATRGGDLPSDRNDEDGFRLVAIPR